MCAPELVVLARFGERESGLVWTADPPPAVGRRHPFSAELERFWLRNPVRNRVHGARPPTPSAQRTDHRLRVELQGERKRGCCESRYPLASSCQPGCLGLRRGHHPDPGQLTGGLGKRVGVVEQSLGTGISASGAHEREDDECLRARKRGHGAHLDHLRSDLDGVVPTSPIQPGARLPLPVVEQHEVVSAPDTLLELGLQESLRLVVCAMLDGDHGHAGDAVGDEGLVVPRELADVLEGAEAAVEIDRALQEPRADENATQQGVVSHLDGQGAGLVPPTRRLFALRDALQRKAMLAYDAASSGPRGWVSRSATAASPAVRASADLPGHQRTLDNDRRASPSSTAAPRIR